MDDYHDDPFDGKTRAECWYADIINMTYQHTKHEPHLTMRQRAAQFAPFAALSGYKEALAECERTTEAFRHLGEDELARLDRLVQQLLTQAKAGRKIEIEVTYFVPDLRKEGGKYINARGVFEGVNNYKKCLSLQGEEEGIPLRYISEIKVLDCDE